MKVISGSVGRPVEEKPGLWYVQICWTTKTEHGAFENHEGRQYFSVANGVVTEFFESPELEQALGPDGLMGYSQTVAKAYEILQNHIAPDGAGYSWAYGLQTRIIQRMLMSDLKKKTAA